MKHNMTEMPDYTKGNPSGLVPKGRSVLVKPYEMMKKTSPIILPPTVGDRQRMIEDRAVVVAIGPAAWDDEAEPRAVIGEHVMISKFAGNMIPGDDGVLYRIVTDRDIYVGINPPKES